MADVWVSPPLDLCSSVDQARKSKFCVIVDQETSSSVRFKALFLLYPHSLHLFAIIFAIGIIYRYIFDDHSIDLF